MKKYILPVAIATATLGSAQAQQTEQPTDWYQDGQQKILELKRQRFNRNKAKNVILFIGDGMGVTTQTAARILQGQLNGQSGEENFLSFEEFPHTALAKTYNSNAQTPDSAGTMVAMVTGVKTRQGTIGVDSDVVRKDAVASMDSDNQLLTILEIAELAGKSTGVVATARVTHATPAACYAKSADRNWEDNSDLSAEAVTAGFEDIASQLLSLGTRLGTDGIEVALGGGRRHFFDRTAPIPAEFSNEGDTGDRTDGRNLAQEWTTAGGNYVFDRDGLLAVDPATTDRLLGLFEESHMDYDADRVLTNEAGKNAEPSLSEMTTSAIDILSKNNDGYFLMVEAGRIDHAHHAGNSYRALTDTIALSNAVEAALAKVDLRETLIIVTADHSHVFTLAGYATRGNDILGVVNGITSSNSSGSWIESTFVATDMLGLPYTVLGYANGPGYTGASSAQAEGLKQYPHFPSTYTGVTAGRPTIPTTAGTLAGPVSDPRFSAASYEVIDAAALGFGTDLVEQEATVPLSSETHSSEDVGVFAIGAGSYVTAGVLEQNVIFHIMDAAMGVVVPNPYANAGQYPVNNPPAP